MFHAPWKAKMISVIKAGFEFGTTICQQILNRPAVVQQITAAGLARQGVTFAAAVVLLIPPLIVFLVAQGNVMETMANSGMKD